jgi:hypothetical protein
VADFYAKYPVMGSGGAAGVSAIGTIDSEVKSADGAVIVVPDLVLQTADATYPGLVSTAAQTIAGVKTFTSDINLSSTGKAIMVNSVDFVVQPNADSTSIAVGLTTLDSMASTGQNNVAVGNDAGTAMTSGSYNVMLGNGALSSSTISSYNTAIGHTAMQSAGAAGSNVAIGVEAMKNIAGNQNVGIGVLALGTATGCYETVAVGHGALLGSAGNFNTAVGKSAGEAVTGASNTIVGCRVGSLTLTSGSSNILLGTSDAVTTLAAGTNNFLNVGNTLFGTSVGSGTVGAPAGRIGILNTAPATALDVTGDVTVSGLTADRALTTNASKVLTSSATTATELGYVSGVTSAIQTQLNGKVATTGNETIAGNKTFSGELICGGNVTLTPTVNNSLTGANQRIPSHTTANMVFTNASLTSIGSANNGGVSGGHLLTITNATGGNVTIVNNYVSAAAGETIITGNNGDAIVPNKGTFMLQYNATSSCWSFIGAGLTNVASGSVTGSLPIANGGTNNGSLAVTAGGTLYTDGSKLVNVGAGTAAQYLMSNGASAPTWQTFTTPTVQRFTSGSGTYTTPAGVKSILVTMVGGGGGGKEVVGNNGSNGGNTTFGSSLLTANGGSGSNGNNGGAGGTVTVSAPAVAVATATGAQGQGSVAIVVATGGSGGSSPFGGAGPGGYNSSAGISAATNSGSGGGGGGGTGAGGAGSGGGAGGFLSAYIVSPSATYAYAVGASGAGGTGGADPDGGAGGSGIIIVEEFYA